MALLRQEPRPREPVTDKQGNVTYRWGIWLDALLQTISQQPTFPTTPLSIADQTASLGATALSLGTTSQGLFRVSWYLRIITAGGAAGTAQVTVRSTDRVAPTEQVGPLLDQAVARTQSGSFLVRRDQATPITVELAYTTAGVPNMSYDLVVAVEVMNQAATT